MLERESYRFNNVKKFLEYMVGIIGIFLSIVLTPPIFSRYLVMSFLLEQEIMNLWIFCGLVLIASLCILLPQINIKSEITLLFLGILFIIMAEIGMRVFIIYVRTWERQKYAYMANKTYSEFLAYIGHPFLHFTGNPSISVIGHQTLGELTPFNNFGFLGKDFTYKKDEHVVRIAALGGSTTADGYPQILEEFLNTNTTNKSYHVEVMNFGLPSYTSAHSLVNFVLNVVDFSPDYVIFHHAWNDSQARNAINFRGDYAHALQYFHEPEIIDKFPLRVSVLYRHLKATFTKIPPNWQDLNNAIIKGSFNNGTMENLEELNPYKRNIITIIQLSNLRGIKVVLTTQPHSTDVTNIYYNEAIAKHVRQCNTIMRQIYQEYHNTVLFVDLDKMMTDKMNHVFVDFAHMNKSGITYKADEIGKVILNNLTENHCDQ